MDEAPEVSLEHPAGFDGARAMATFVYVADQAIAHVETARALLEQCPIRCGVTCVNSVLVFSCGTIVSEGKLVLYYGAADKVIGVAVGDLPGKAV